MEKDFLISMRIEHLDIEEYKKFVWLVEQIDDCPGFESLAKVLKEAINNRTVV